MQDTKSIQCAYISAKKFAQFSERGGAALILESREKVIAGDPIKLIEVLNDGTPTGTFAVRLMTFVTRSRASLGDEPPNLVRYIVGVQPIH